MTFDQFKQFIAQLAAQANKEDANGEVQKIMAKLTKNTGPGTTGTTVSTFWLWLHRVLIFPSNFCLPRMSWMLEV